MSSKTVACHCNEAEQLALFYFDYGFIKSIQSEQDDLSRSQAIELLEEMYPNNHVRRIVTYLGSELEIKDYHTAFINLAFSVQMSERCIFWQDLLYFYYFGDNGELFRCLNVKRKASLMCLNDFRALLEQNKLLDVEETLEEFPQCVIDEDLSDFSYSSQEIVLIKRTELPAFGEQNYAKQFDVALQSVETTASSSGQLMKRIKYEHKEHDWDTGENGVVNDFLLHKEVIQYDEKWGYQEESVFYE